MMTATRILSVLEEGCIRIGAKLHDDELDGYQLTDIETALRLIDGALARYLRESSDQHRRSARLCSAQAAHKGMHDRLDLVDHYRNEILVGELQALLREAQRNAVAVLLALQWIPESESPLMISARRELRVLTHPAMRYTSEELRMGIGRTRK